MKIAIYLSGRVNCYESFLDQIEKFKKSHNSVDIFLSVNGSYDQRVVDDIKPVAYYFEPYSTPERKLYIHKRPETSVYNTYSQFFNNLQAFKLIKSHQEKHSFKYDVVMKYRSDMVAGSFALEHIDLSSIKPNVLYVPKGNDNCGLNDLVGLGNFETMEKYSSLYDSIEKYLIDQEVVCNPEIILSHHIKMLELSIERFSFDLTLHRDRNKSPQE